MKPWRMIAIVPPGCEALAADELKELGVRHIDARPGHLSLTGHPDLLVKLHQLARLPSRFLVQLAEFKAKSFGEFRRKCSLLDLSPFVTAEASLAFHTTTKHCKLHHTGALEEAALRGWERSDDGEVDASTQTIFIRGEDDIFTLSLDASGDHLYRRGVLIKRGEAPLRENLAAAMVRLIDHSVDFWDPFCGSGTLMLERWLQLTRYPLGAFRAFAFESWPCINTERREKVTAELLKASTPCVSKIQGSDADPAAVQMSQENLAVLPASHGSIDVKSFEIKAGMEIDPKDTPMAIMTNPPYNDRLEQNAEHLLALAKWARSKDAVTLYYLLPKASKKLGLKVVLSFQNGGKRVKVFSR